MKPKRPRRIWLVYFALALTGICAMGFVGFRRFQHELALNHALIEAVKANDPVRTARLLAQGADVNVQDNPLDESSEKPVSTLQQFVNVLKGRRSPPKLGIPLLSLALSAQYDVDGGSGYVRIQDRVPLVKVLLDAGADVNARDNKGATPLLSAVGNSSDLLKELSLINLLLSRGANVNVHELADSNPGTTPLQLAAIDEDGLSVMESLLKHGARVDDTDDDGSTALMSAVPWNVKGVEMLLRYHANPNIRDKYGNTALSLCLDHTSSKSTKPMIVMLRKAGAKQ